MHEKAREQLDPALGRNVWQRWSQEVICSWEITVTVLESHKTRAGTLQVTLSSVCSSSQVSSQIFLSLSLPHIGSQMRMWMPTKFSTISFTACHLIQSYALELFAILTWPPLLLQCAKIPAWLYFIILWLRNKKEERGSHAKVWLYI